MKSKKLKKIIKDTIECIEEDYEIHDIVFEVTLEKGVLTRFSLK